MKVGDLMISKSTSGNIIRITRVSIDWVSFGFLVDPTRYEFSYSMVGMLRMYKPYTSFKQKIKVLL